MSSFTRMLQTRGVLGGASSVEVEGVPVQLALAKRDWMVRVLPHMIPDSPVADAQEKIPFALLKQLTQGTHPPGSFSDVFAGKAKALEDLFVFETRGGSGVPIAFHVLMSKVRDTSVVHPRTYAERTFLMLCTRRGVEGLEDNLLDEAFIERLFGRFRIDPRDLAAAERYVLETLEPSWNPDAYSPDARGTYTAMAPFVPEGGEAFRRDVDTLIDAGLRPAEFFRWFTQTLAIHLGMLQPRLASRLNPAMTRLEALIAGTAGATFEDVVRSERGETDDSRFAGRYAARAPDLEGQRPISRGEPVYLSYQEMERDLVALHFNLVVFNHLRRLTQQHIRHQAPTVDQAMLEAMTARPGQIAERTQLYPGFRSYLDGAAAALAVRMGRDMLVGHEAQLDAVAREATSGIHALRLVAERYNRQPPATPEKSRARKSGIQASASLLGAGDDGLAPTRQGVGRFLQVGAGLIPLFLLLIIGAREEKCRLDVFWERFEEYGLRFDEHERELMLRRLKSMGLFERFSDAGEANYVRNLLVTGHQGGAR